MENKEHRYYTSLFEIAASLGSSSDTDEVLKRIVEVTTKALDVKGCSLLLVTPDRKRLQHSVSYGLSEPYLQKGPIMVDKRFGEVLNGNPIVVHDTSSDSMFQYPKEAKQEGIASILSVPMKLRGEVIGAVCAYCTKSGRFSEDDTYFTSGVANLGAIALDNARRYELSRKDYESCVRDMLYWGSKTGL